MTNAGENGSNSNSSGNTAGETSSANPNPNDNKPTKPEYRQPKSNISGKEGAKDKPSWVTERPLVGQNGKQFAVQEMNKKFGRGNWDRKTADGAYDKIRKYADRSFEK